MANVLHITGLAGEPIELELVNEDARAASPERAMLAAIAPERAALDFGFDSLERNLPIVHASRAFFGGARVLALREAARAGIDLDVESILRSVEPGPAVLREPGTGLVRTVHREIAVRFKPGVSDKTRDRILAQAKVKIRRPIEWAPDQYVVADPTRKTFGADLFPIANKLAQRKEVVFATPNFVSQYQRERGPRIGAAQWHLDNVASVAGQVAGQDVRVRRAWAKTRAAGITIAIIDDGVDLEHPYLRKRIWRNPDSAAADQVGRDFYLPNDHPDHYNPRPKIFEHPYDSLARNDIHGTPCAGLAAAAGFDVPGVAPSARILAVKVFHASELAPDERVADAIRYAASRADVISCSWTGGRSPDVEQALVDAATIGRGGRGTAVFCATGNANGRPVGFPGTRPELDRGRRLDRRRRARRLCERRSGGRLRGAERGRIHEPGVDRRLLRRSRVQPGDRSPARTRNGRLQRHLRRHADRRRCRGAGAQPQPEPGPRGAPRDVAGLLRADWRRRPGVAD